MGSACDNSGTPTKVLKEDIPGQSPHTNTRSVDNNIKKAKVQEALHAGTYTYLRLLSDNKEFWAAISARPVDTGKTYFYKESILMMDFRSKQLERTFDTIMFIDSFYDADHPGMDASKPSSPRDHTSTNKEENLSVDHSEDEIPLGELFRGKENYNGETIVVKGKVVKISKNIMDRNWIHIQDGSSYKNEFDLTITHYGTIDFKLNDIVTFRGIITLDKDFGAGYVYSVILENAEVIK